MSPSDLVLLRHHAPFRLPSRCACCLAETSGTAVTWIPMGGGLRRQFPLPECAQCRRRKTRGLVYGALVLIGSGALGLALGVSLFPLGALRLVPIPVVMVVSFLVFAWIRRRTHPAGHARHCEPIAKADVNPTAGPTQTLKVHFANAEFARLWRELNPDSAPEGGS